MRNVRPSRRKPHPVTGVDLAITLGLFVIAKVLFVLITPFGFMYEIATRVWARDWIGLADYFYVCAASDDQAGGAYNMSLFNKTLIRATDANAHWFGNKDEVISSVLGKNKRTGTLTPLGVWVERILDKIDPQHTDKAIEIDEQNPRH